MFEGIWLWKVYGPIRVFQSSKKGYQIVKMIVIIINNPTVFSQEFFFFPEAQSKPMKKKGPTRRIYQVSKLVHASPPVEASTSLSPIAYEYLHCQKPIYHLILSLWLSICLSSLLGFWFHLQIASSTALTRV